MAHHYITVDGDLGGTGIKDGVTKEELNASDLGLPKVLAERIAKWTEAYDDFHYSGFEDRELAKTLDEEGLAICDALDEALPGRKIEYFSHDQTRTIYRTRKD